MIIENIMNREGYYGVMLNNGDNSLRDELVGVFVWGKYDGTDNYITVTDSDSTKTYPYDSFAEAMQNAIYITKRY